MIRKRQPILIDCDGVLADFVALYLELLRTFTGRDHGHDDVTDFAFSKCVASRAEDERVWRHIDAHPGLVRSLGWHHGSREALAELRSISRVICVTSPHHGPTWMPERMAWLREEAGFDKRDIVFASDKNHVAGACLIEDKAEAANAWHFSTGDYSVGILIARPWNASERIQGGVAVAHSWDEAIAFARAAVEYM